MTDTPTTIVDRLTQHRDGTTTATADRLRVAAQRDADRRGTFPAGTRVLDRVTGLEGVVNPMPTASSSASVLVPVRLDRGDLVLRPTVQLMWRPTPPRA